MCKIYVMLTSINVDQFQIGKVVNLFEWPSLTLLLLFAKLAILLITSPTNPPTSQLLTKIFASRARYTFSKNLQFIRIRRLRDPKVNDSKIELCLTYIIYSVSIIRFYYVNKPIHKNMLMIS